MSMTTCIMQESTKVAQSILNVCPYCFLFLFIIFHNYTHECKCVRLLTFNSTVINKQQKDIEYDDTVHAFICLTMI